MRVLLALLLMLATAPTLAGSSAGGWNPAADYVVAGQDEPGYRAWYARSGWRPVQVKAFNDYLTLHGVGGVVPTWQLLRTASDWHKCGAEAFEVPPTAAWPNIVAALRYVGAYVEPVVGPVEVVSVYRNPSLNACAGGAPASTHLTLGAVDMVPLRPTSREALMTSLCRIHLASGPWNGIGLGFYKGLRFHIDARNFREWGTAGAAGGTGCNAVLAEGPMPYRPELPGTYPPANAPPPFPAKTIVPPPKGN